LRQAVREKLFERQAQFTFVYPGMKKSELYLKYALPPGTNIIVAQRWAADVFNFLRHKIPDFKSSHILWQAKQVGERDCPRLAGEYVLKSRDVLRGRKFSAAVINGAWPGEFWDTT
jgi:hypothetical protein